jgi:uncharacterized repeat protein (TIGR03803 family)
MKKLGVEASGKSINRPKPWIMNTTLCLMAWALCSTFAAAQAQYKVLYNFGSVPNDGLAPEGSLISDSYGNLYGTTAFGGTGAGGTVFELSPQPGGTWNEAVLYNFCTQAGCADGFQPQAGLVIDSAGNLYGTTYYGPCTNGEGHCGGVVFELSPPLSGGAWTYSVLYTFCSVFNDGCLDGSEPRSQLVFDASGNLYGTTREGGNGHYNGQANNGGVVFELSPSLAGGWTETVLYNFCTKGSQKICLDGAYPYAGVVFGPDGNLYGTTSEGGGKVKNADGVVYQLSPGSDGWTETVLITQYFSQSYAPVSFSAAGNLFSTTLVSAFELNAKKQSSRSMQFTRDEGTSSEAGVLIDGARNALFGTTSADGPDGGGTVWEVTPSRQLVSIYSFCSLANCADGGVPTGNLIEDQSGNLYGTAEYGGLPGNNGYNGVVYEITP